MKATAATPKIGILGLQGAVIEHAQHLESAGASTTLVKIPEQLQDIDALVLPGGESTTMMLGIEREGLAEHLAEFVRSGKPVLATCAGMIILDQNHLQIAPYECERNAFGRQLASKIIDLNVEGFGQVEAVFIRAPKLSSWSSEVIVTATLDGDAVAARWNNCQVYAFHPELSETSKIHSQFVKSLG